MTTSEPFIWVGIFEAHAIGRAIENIQTPRPSTHDLIKNIINGVEGKVNRIVVNDVQDNTFFAEISIQMNGSEVVIDSRPSDAIALALLISAPIFVEGPGVNDNFRAVHLGGNLRGPCHRACDREYSNAASLDA